MKRVIAAGTVALATAFSGTAAAQNEQFVPANFYWVGPYAPGGSGIAGGMLDYFQLLNERDGGINGVKLTWEKCETEYNNARGVECYERSKDNGPTGATLIHPLSTGITYSLIDKGTADKIPIVSIGYGRADAAYGRVFPYVFPLITTYWDQAAAMVRYIGGKENGLEKLKGKITHIHLIDSDGSLNEHNTSTHNPFGTGKLDFDKLIPALNQCGVPHDWWCIDLCFWPDAWEVTADSKVFLDKLRRKYAA